MSDNFKKELKNIEDELSQKSSMVLATSAYDKVTARSVSTIFDSGFIYFQTDNNMKKYNQIKTNKNVELSIYFLQIEGTASDIGTWDQNPELLKLYITKYKNSYETYKNISTEIVIKIKNKKIKK